jgi:phosphoglycerate dehydrogenase-like enzyme
MPATADEMNKLLPECDVVFGQLNAASLAKAKNLMWVQNLEAGLEREMFPELVAHPCAMTNMARMYAPALGETCFAMLLALTRGIQKYYVPQFDRKEWISNRWPNRCSWTRCASRSGSWRWSRRWTYWSAAAPAHRRAGE